MNKTEEFIEAYKKLEHTVRNVYHLSTTDSISYYLIHNDKYRLYKEEIAYCQKVRNFIQHEEKIEDDFAIVPSSKMLEFIDTLIKKIENESTCKDIMIQNIYYQILNGNVMDTIFTMKQHDFSHVPIIENNKVIGIFNKDVILETVHMLHSETTFKDIQKYLSIRDKHYKFVSENLYIEDLEDIFISNYRRGNRIDLLLVTENGNKEEKLNGIISPWMVLQEKEN